MRVLITGMCGFIGHHVADVLLETTDWDLIGLDRIDGTSTLHRLHHVREWADKARRVSFVWHDLRAPINELVAARIGPVDVILHLAASTHVDRSIADSMQFVMDNVVGTCHVLEYARSLGTDLKVMVNFSTDEVFGPAGPGRSFSEWDRYRASNPYSASKSAAEEFGVAYHNTYDVPVVSTHCMNAYGERQHPEKFIPLVIGKVLLGQKLLVHADPSRTIPGERGYIYAPNVGHVLRDLVNAVVGARFIIGGKLNLPAQRYMDNLAIAQHIAALAGKPLIYDLVDFHSSRPGHDLRYALDGTLFQEHGFTYPEPFDATLERTVRWYLEHKEWLAGPR